MLQELVRNKSVLFGIAAVTLCVLGLVLPPYWTQLLTRILIMALFATSINMQVGNAGMMALGHSTFLGLGAYSFGLLFLRYELSLILALVFGLLFSAVVIVTIGYLCLRGDSMTFALLNLGFNILSYTLAMKWISLTGGNSGITGVARPDIFSSTPSFYFLVLAVVLVCYVLISIMLDSPFGKVARGLRENEERLRFLGINTDVFRLVIFTISGFFAAIAGVLLAMLDRGIFPSCLTPTKSAEGLMMVLIGGMYSFLGPSLGAVIVVAFTTVASNYVSQWQGLLGVIVIASAIGFRGGILGRKKSKLRLSRRSAINDGWHYQPGRR